MEFPINFPWISHINLQIFHKIHRHFPSPTSFQDGMTALHLAARRGQTETVRLLLSAGSDKDPKTKDCGATPLHLAAMKGSLPVVRSG